MDERTCLFCHELLKGRSDQKFCNYRCRNSYNNHQYFESNNVIRTINKILKKNYFILDTMTSEGKTIASKSELQKKGYRFEFFTCSNPTRNNRINYYCYDKGFRDIDNNKIILVHRNLKDELSISSKLN